MQPEPCRVCGDAGTQTAGTVDGRWAHRPFHLAQCGACGYAWIVDPLEDLGAVYSMDYYRGKGADPLVDYFFELEHPEETIRRYEWDGVRRAVEAHVKVDRRTRWLDFGCGNGGLVRHLRSEVGCPAVGSDTGAIVPIAREHGIPILDDGELDAAGPFDVITAVEVLEHVDDPHAVVGRIASLLAPGGVLFITTGNAAPFRDRLSTWSYVLPEVHVSFYEPRTLSLLQSAAGLEPTAPRLAGWDDIYWFKVLKNTRRSTRTRLTDRVPRAGLARLLERRFALAAHPVGRRGDV